MSQKKVKKFKLKYDVVISTAVILSLIIYAVSKLFGGFPTGDTDSVSEAEVFVPVIYLSPSNQEENIYAAGDTNEAEVMRTISMTVKKYLEQNDVSVYIASPELTLQERIDYVNGNEFTAHVAIHSNTGAELKSEEGTRSFYNSKVEGSKELSDCIYSRVSRLTPTLDEGMFDGTEGATFLYETAESKVPSCMIEIEYHDKASRAKWIIEHEEQIGKAIADGILQYIEIL